MYNQNSVATGAKWYFWLAIVILIGAFALGFNIKDAKWLNGKIADATAEQMSVFTDVDRQKAELDLQLLRTQTEIEIAQQRQQAEYEATRKQQELDAWNVANTQTTNFKERLYSTFNFGIMAVMIVISVVLIITGISVGVGLYKVLHAKAQAIQPNKPSMVVMNKYQRRASPVAQKARQREREARERQILNNRLNQIFRDSEQIWPSNDGISENADLKNYPWVK